MDVNMLAHVSVLHRKVAASWC